MNVILKTFAVLALSVASAATAIAHSSNEKNPYIVHRQGIYQVAGGHINALKAILMLGHPATTDINYHAKAMLEAFKHHGNAFPSGSDKGKTHAKQNVWTDAEDFKQHGQDAGKALMALIKASEGDDMKLIKSKFAGVGKSCKNCHDEFRKKGSH